MFHILQRLEADFDTMIKGKFLENISANTFQLVCNQMFGLAIFYTLSKDLDKTSFGQINLVLAILLTCFQILSFGMDQVLIRKIAALEKASSLLTIYVAHVLITGALFYALLLFTGLLLPQFSGTYQLLLFIGIGKLMIFFSTPFKLLATGLERFRVFAWMSVVSNIIRGSSLVIFALISQISIQTVVVIFIAGDVAELLFCIYLNNKALKIPLEPRWNKSKHVLLIKESVSQFGVVIFSSALSRLDWIFIGILVSADKLAEYSFAYKIFEIATLPLLALAPLLVPRFTKLLQDNRLQDRMTDLGLLLRMQIIIASATALVLNILWIPVIDMVTQGKYGSVNMDTILILSMTMPLLYFNNFLWSINFAKGRFKMIFRVIMIAFIVNLSGDILLIPFLKNEGAAVAYFLAILAQSLLYIRKTDLSALIPYYHTLWICPVCAIISGISASLLFTNIFFILISAIPFFIIFLFITQQLRATEWKDLKRILY